MNIEQERADFESWLYLDQTKYDPERMSKQEIEIAKIAYQAGRAALQSQAQIPAPTNRDEYIALLDRVIDMGKQLNVMWEEAFAEVRVKHGLQSQDREDAARIEFLEKEWFYRNTKGVWAFGFSELWDAGQHESLREAIDHARSVEGDGK